jgi:hypothetical protein
MEWEKARAALSSGSGKDATKSEEFQRKEKEAADQFIQMDQKTKYELREAIGKRYVAFDDYYKKVCEFFCFHLF